MREVSQCEAKPPLSYITMEFSAKTSVLEMEIQWLLSQNKEETIELTNYICNP